MKRIRLTARLRCVGFVFCAAAGCVSTARADIKLPAVFSDNMVLQQGAPVAVWGWADKGEAVTVTFAGQTQKAETGGDGKWSLKLQPLQATDHPAEMIVAGKNTVTLANVVVGEVWICSGQSNMEFPVARARNSDQEIAAADHPMIRLFTVPKKVSAEPLNDTKGQWQPCSTKSVPEFTAVGYFFGRELHEKLKVPVGLIHTSWGGTPAEAWTPKSYLEGKPELSKLIPDYDKQSAGFDQRKAAYEKALEKWKATSAAAKKAGTKAPNQPRPPVVPDEDPHRPTVLYNGMIQPIVPYTSKGAIWYQGESNSGRAYEYRTLLPTMIKSWRDAWAEPNLQFLIVQLANYRDPAKEPGDDAWAELREAQTMTARQPNNGMALAIDLADADNPGDIHPKNKQDVGKRLALVALNKTYGKTDVAAFGPSLAGMKVQGDHAVISFDHAEGLMSKGGEAKGFAIAGEDHKWHWADAKIEGTTVVVSSPQVKQPVAVRYAWSTNPMAALYNGAGLPAEPFRTDDWPGVTQPK